MVVSVVPLCIPVKYKPLWQEAQKRVGVERGLTIKFKWRIRCFRWIFRYFNQVDIFLVRDDAPARRLNRPVVRVNLAKMNGSSSGIEYAQQVLGKVVDLAVIVRASHI